MSEKDFYNTIDKEAVAEYKDKGSKFIAYAFAITGVDDFKTRLITIKELHPKASHHCFAYRLGVDGTTFRVSDAGEPSGTAGRPILGQIDSKELTNTLIIVVRYFGGTLLGVPGLINAYKNAAALALQVSSSVQKFKEEIYRLEFSYPCMNDVMRLIKQQGIAIIRQDIQLFCVVEISVQKNREEWFLQQAKNLYDISCKKI
ncbi:MAG: YigZ family protein [Sphingobacteriales bacterium]|jgi:uncharacterized YigZ family protein|nr:MAG: YigZ family protein [Sphingobacteriales bacterium]